ncbi:MAG: tRNA preQ1(34) S-adenosylmethionine ribosyltransferase-isomerase QueA [Patescibacteria group bacterium]|jgi:S-adenosylmethionine:tRNA ribosyltransferase-isomerase
MKLSDFDYHLPKELIAQRPVKPRDCSRLLVLSRKTGKIIHRHFYDLPDFLRSGDVLVFNNSKVMKARLYGRKETGGKIEVFLLRKIRSEKSGEIWQCLLGGTRKKEGLCVRFGKGFSCEIKSRNAGGTWEAAFNKKGKEFQAAVEQIGHMPLPPYIKRKDLKTDEMSYQTIYADSKKTGSVAAPTAGLHFTPGLLKKLEKKGIKFEYLTLHVGLGTFAPVKAKDVKKHKMHSEWAEVSAKTIKSIVSARKEKRRVIAVGTTSVRTLEAAFASAQEEKFSGLPAGQAGWVDIFIYPGYKFKAIDGMITNFHLPKSTLLMLVSALAGRKDIGLAYRAAVKKNYRFFSYGDAMLIA